jgi:pseudaminic acid cytidylyltransferase
MRVAVIPARGGSKRIPRKNIKLFSGKPMIQWSIAAAVASECFDEIIVSTDDLEIKQVAEAAGASVPFLRPEHLSGDIVGTTPVVAHAIQYLLDQGKNVDLACCIYATAPFLSAQDLCSGFDAIRNSAYDYVFSATSYDYPIQRAFKVLDGRVYMDHPELFKARSQDLPEMYHDAGQFYWGTTEAWLNDKPVFTASSNIVYIPRVRTQDIDTPEDWQQAELMHRLMAL